MQVAVPSQMASLSELGCTGEKLTVFKAEVVKSGAWIL